MAIRTWIISCLRRAPDDGSLSTKLPSMSRAPKTRRKVEGQTHCYEGQGSDFQSTAEHLSCVSVFSWWWSHDQSSSCFSLELQRTERYGMKRSSILIRSLSLSGTRSQKETSITWRKLVWHTCTSSRRRWRSSPSWSVIHRRTASRSPNSPHNTRPSPYSRWHTSVWRASAAFIH